MVSQKKAYQDVVDEVSEKVAHIQETQLSLGWADRTAYIRRPESDFRSWKESDFPE